MVKRKDELETLSPADQKKLEKLEAQLEQGANIDWEKLGQEDPVFVLRLIALFRPKAVRRA